MHVTVRNGRDGKPDVNGAIRVLKKKLMKEGFFQELRRRESFMSKGEKERKAKAAGRKRWQRKQEKLKAERGY
jgi:ribosomal protein S21